MPRYPHKYCRVCNVELTEDNSYIKTLSNWLCLTHYKEYRKKKNPLTGMTDMQKYELKNNKTPKRRKQMVETTKRMIKKYPEKWDARAKVSYAVKTGKLIRPSSCERCKTVTKIQGHHEDYSKPLEVMWLCKKCHVDRHYEIKRLTTLP